MPELARLQTQLSLEEFQIVSCNLDEPEKWKTHIVPALHDAGANYPCVVVQRSARSALRSWLAPDWSFDLPARFIIDRQGRITARVMSGTPLASARQEVRRLVLDDGASADRASRMAGVTALRVRLIDVTAGEGYSLSEVSVASPDPRGLAEQAVELIAARINRSDNPRIAILPFASSRDRLLVGAFSHKTTQHVLATLRNRGYYDLVSPERAQSMIDKAGTTSLAIEFDPSVVQGRLGCDYLVIGWLRGDVVHSAPNQSLATDQTHLTPRTATVGHADADD